MSNDHHHLEDFFGEPKEPLRNSIKNGNSLAQRLRLLPKVLSVHERYLIGALLAVVIVSVVALPFTIYRHFTTTLPADGGTFSEGLVGQPRHINPLLAQTNNPDRDISALVYSGLLTYNSSGQLVPDLAKSYDISPDGLNYTIYLKQNAQWSDGKPVTAEDVVYTIQTAQTADYSS